jgi:ADP-ribose pyrophosphatase
MQMRTPVHQETAFKGRLFSVDVLQVPGNDDTMHRREVVRHPGAVVIVPVLPDGTLAMIRNYRVAVDQWLWELPAGKLEDQEDPQLAAVRELEEETGYTSATVEKLGVILTSPGFTDERIHVFLARDLKHVGQRLEAGEHIELAPMALDAVLAMVDDGELCDGKTIAALMLWQRRYQDT